MFGASGSVVQGFFPQGIGQLSRQLAGRAVQMHQIRNGSAAVLPADFAFLHGHGRPLPDAVRQRMEDVFGTGLADVRVHSSPQPGHLGTVAMTRGSNICIAPGHYDPSSPRGQRILARELAHVVQQRTGRARNPFGGVAVVYDHSLEREADQFAERVVQQRVFAPRLAAPVRQPHWLRQGGRVVWSDARGLTDFTLRPTGQHQWYSWWRPREFNELLDVYERRAAAIRFDPPRIGNPTELTLRSETFDANDLLTIGAMTNLIHLDLVNCKFPSQWNSQAFSNLNNLRSLRIYSPNACTLTDQMAGIAGLANLSILQFVRCDFFNDVNIYATVGAMTNLTVLDLGRTLTKEKSRGTLGPAIVTNGVVLRNVTQVDPAIMTSLRALIEFGMLRTLDIRWCSGMSTAQIRSLVDLGLAEGCRVLTEPLVAPSPAAEFNDIVSRIR